MRTLMFLIWWLLTFASMCACTANVKYHHYDTAVLSFMTFLLMMKLGWKIEE